MAASLPVSGRSLDITTGSAAENGDKSQNRTAARARIIPGYNEVFLDAFDVNLDNDEDLEQVIVVKPSTEAQARDRLSVVIADFLALTGNYHRLWKGETLAVKPKAFIIQPRDLLGDGRIELLCFGIDEANRQTLTIFRPSNAEGTRYKTIFSESGLSIQVIDSQNEDRSRRPALIQVFEAAKNTSSPLDQIRLDFTWSSWAEAYRLGTSTSIPGEKVEKNYIDRIITGSAVDFESYLDGLWEKEGQAAGQAILLSFQTSKREITINGRPDVEVWDWEDSSPAFAGIKSSISNGTVPDMIRLLSIDLVGVDRIHVNAHAQQLARFSPTEDWDGTYRRFAGPAAAARRDGFVPMLAARPLGSLEGSGGVKFDYFIHDLEGSYLGTGFALVLEGGLYRLAERSESRRGRYYFFKYRDLLILDLDPYEEATDPKERRTYILLVVAGPGNSIAGMRLRPAQTASGAVLPLYKPDIVLKRINSQGTK
ncbi:MAG: pallilysin-related adhesin [Spirochaetes bacterium]|nr:pallilysin-related adhesin [Spirochaetota bacterium]